MNDKFVAWLLSQHNEMHFKRFDCVSVCLCVCVRARLGVQHMQQVATPRLPQTPFPHASRRPCPTHLHSGSLILWHSFVVGGSLMHVTCRARDFRAYLALDVQHSRTAWKKMKSLTCCKSGGVWQAARDRDDATRFIVYMFYAL